MSTPTTPTISFAAAVLARGNRAEQHGNTHDATARYTQAWVRAIEAGDDALAQTARRALIDACRAERNVSAATAAYTSVIDELHGLDAARAHHDLAMLMSEGWQRGDIVDPDDVFAHFTDAATGYQSTNAFDDLARLEVDQAVLQFAVGDADIAISSLARAVSRWRTAGDNSRLAETLLTLGDCLDANDQAYRAVMAYREAEVIFSGFGDTRSANAAATRAELAAHRRANDGVVIDLRANDSSFV